jgi:hypothetical protein
VAYRFFGEDFALCFMLAESCIPKKDDGKLVTQKVSLFDV